MEKEKNIGGGWLSMDEDSLEEWITDDEVIPAMMGDKEREESQGRISQVESQELTTTLFRRKTNGSRESLTEMMDTIESMEIGSRDEAIEISSGSGKGGEGNTVRENEAIARKIGKKDRWKVELNKDEWERFQGRDKQKKKSEKETRAERVKDKGDERGETSRLTRDQKEKLKEITESFSGMTPSQVARKTITLLKDADEARNKSSKIQGPLNRKIKIGIHAAMTALQNMADRVTGNREYILEREKFQSLERDKERLKKELDKMRTQYEKAKTGEQDSMKGRCATLELEKEDLRIRLERARRQIRSLQEREKDRNIQEEEVKNKEKERTYEEEDERMERAGTSRGDIWSGERREEYSTDGEDNLSRSGNSGEQRWDSSRQSRRKLKERRPRSQDWRDATSQKKARKEYEERRNEQRDNSEEVRKPAGKWKKEQDRSKWKNQKGKEEKEEREKEEQRTRSVSRRRIPRSEAITINCIGEDITYAGVIAKARKEINLEAMGIHETRIKRTVTGGVMIELPGKEMEEKANELAEKLQEVFRREKVTINRPKKKGELRITGVDDSITEKEIAREIAIEGECGAENIKVGTIKRTKNGLGMAWAQCPLAGAIKIAKAGELRIGWTRARVELLGTRPLRCYKCLEKGHVMARCPNDTDRRGTCYNCGREGHKETECREKARCISCERKGKDSEHRIGSERCPVSLPVKLKERVGTEEKDEEANEEGNGKEDDKEKNNMEVE